MTAPKISSQVITEFSELDRADMLNWRAEFLKTNGDTWKSIEAEKMQEFAGMLAFAWMSARQRQLDQIAELEEMMGR